MQTTARKKQGAKPKFRARPGQPTKERQPLRPATDQLTEALLAFRHRRPGSSIEPGSPVQLPEPEPVPAKTHAVENVNERA